VNVETKEQSKQWIPTHSSNKPRKFKQTLSARKLAATVSWDRKGVLMVQFMQQGSTRTSEVYCVRNTKNLRTASQNKRSGMLTHGVVLLQDNARAHTSAAGRNPALLEQFNWELFDHLPYSPDLAPSDYHLFSYLKNWVRSQRFNSNEGLMEGVKTWLSSQATEFFRYRHTKTYSPIQVPQFRRVTTLRISLSMYVYLYTMNFFLIACLVNSSPGGCIIN
jgi:histone-lysine N-methyltransferase SETMAR